MSGKHSAKKSSKLTIIAVAAVIVAIAVICVIIFIFAGNNSDNITPSTASTAQTASSAQAEEAATTQSADDESATAEITASAAEETTEPDDDHGEPSTQIVVVPTESGEDVSYFSGTYSPYMAVDASTGSECSFKEVFGSSYAGGSFVFNSDGTFLDSLSRTSSNSGAYAVSGDSIIATYTNDKNVTISVVEWSGDTPSEFIINYGGYNVYFS